MFSPAINPNTVSRRRMILTLGLVWTGWFTANLAANGVFYMAAQGRPYLRLPGEILYFAGVSLMGILIPYHLCRQWGLELSLFPRRKSGWFWPGSILFLLLAIFLGVQAMAEQGMALSEVFSHSLSWALAPLPIFIPTMIAYTMLWYGLMLRGWERIFGGKWWATAVAIVISALFYGFYHFSSIDEISTLRGMLSEAWITTLIGVGFGIYVVLARSLLAAFFVNWILNWFVFTPMDTFHPPVWQWPVGILVLFALWLVYRLGWVEQADQSLKTRLQTGSRFAASNN